MTTRRLLVTALFGLSLLATTPTLRVEAAAKKPSASEPVFTPKRLAGKYRWVKFTVMVTFAKGNTSGGDVLYGPNDTAGADVTPLTLRSRPPRNLLPTPDAGRDR